MKDATLSLSIHTPTTWEQRQRVKRRVGRPSRQESEFAKHPADKNNAVQKAKAELLIKAIESQVLIKKSPSQSLQLDPFHTFPVPSTGCVATMAKYFIQNDIYFESLIALCRATWLSTQGQPTSEDKAFVWHRGNIMNKLRTRLEDPVLCADDGTLLTVATLGTIDYILGDHTAAIAHVTGMKQMVKIRGGFNSSTPWERLLQNNMLAYESLWSFLFAADETPSTGQLQQNSELTIYLSHPFNPEVCQMLSSLPSGFTDVGLTGVLSLQMIRLLTDLSELLLTFPSPGSYNGSNNEAVAATLRRNLQSTLEDLHRLSTLQTTPTERFLCHGLIAYCYVMRALYLSERLAGFYSTASKTLCDIALKQPVCRQTADRKCILWTHVMIATTLQNTEQKPPNWADVMTLFMAQYPEARTWKRLEKDLRTFFWDDRLGALAKGAYEAAGLRVQQQARAEPLPTMAIRNVIL